MTSMIVCRPTLDKNFLKDAFKIGQKICPQWPEIIIALMIINENIATNLDRVVITYNNYAITVRPQEEGDNIHEFYFLKIAESIPKKSLSEVNKPVDGIEQRLNKIGAKVINLQEKGYVIYLEMQDANVTDFIAKVDSILLVLFPNWQDGARQSIASISKNSKSKMIQIPYNGYWINIFQNTFSFSNGKNKFILGISKVK